MGPAARAARPCRRKGPRRPVSTLGEQRTENYALAPITEEAFVTAVTEGLAEPPEYFAQEVVVNRAGHASFDADVPVAKLSAAAVERRHDGALLLDVRDDQAFAAGHLTGSVNVGLC
ncbi:MAG: rhodanese-like domain-containing protein [Actinomycetota bacterium]|nr:rhodanese-like domain-containing protein [Actinomycetota bacterium]